MRLLTRAVDKARGIAARFRGGHVMRHGSDTGRVSRGGSTAATLDLNAPSVALDPFLHFEELRRGGTVHFLPRHQFWLVLGYDEVRAVFAEPQVYSNQPYNAIDGTLLASDPPGHTVVRRIVSRYFSGAALGDLSTFADERAAALVSPQLDVVGDYAAPLSQSVAARLVGFDDHVYRALLEASAAARNDPDPFLALTSALDRLVDRAALYHTIVSDSEGLLGDLEVRSLVRLLWLASTATTERVIGRAVLLLLQHEAVRREVERDSALIPAFVEEVVRLYPPEHMIARLVTQPVELGGMAIPAGATLQLCLPAANRDPARFEDPATIRLDRTGTPHVSFGNGVHRCVGAPLARRVVAAALRTLMNSLPGFRALQPLSTVRFIHSANALSPEHLTIGT
jgi:cytochrome P450